MWFLAREYMHSSIYFGKRLLLDTMKEYSKLMVLVLLSGMMQESGFIKILPEVCILTIKVPACPKHRASCCHPNFLLECTINQWLQSNALCSSLFTLQVKNKMEQKNLKKLVRSWVRCGYLRYLHISATVSFGKIKSRTMLYYKTWIFSGAIIV